MAGYEVHRLSSEKMWELHGGTDDTIHAYYYGSAAWMMKSNTFVRNWYFRQRHKAHRLVKKYIRVRPHIMHKVDAFYNRTMAGRHVIGAHIRGTDKQKDIGGRVVEPVDYLPHIDKFLNQYPTDGAVFVATDSPKFLRTMQAQPRYKGRIFWYEALRSEKNIFLDSSSADNYRKGEDVIIDMLLLSRCDFLLKTSSAVGEFAVYFNLKLHEHSLDLQFSKAVDDLPRPM